MDTYKFVITFNAEYDGTKQQLADKMEDLINSCWDSHVELEDVVVKVVE